MFDDIEIFLAQEDETPSGGRKMNYTSAGTFSGRIVPKGTKTDMVGDRLVRKFLFEIFIRRNKVFKAPVSVGDLKIRTKGLDMFVDDYVHDGSMVRMKCYVVN